MPLDVEIDFALDIADPHADAGRGAGRDLVHHLARVAGRVGVRDVRRHQRDAGLIDLQAGESRRERLRETHGPAPVTDNRRSFGGPITE